MIRRSLAALAVTALLVAAPTAAFASHGADDPAGHQRHSASEARHGGDDARHHARHPARHHHHEARHHHRPGGHHRHGGHDDGPNHR
jgi:hypothetical protein